MFRRILLPYDGLAQTKPSAQFAMALAQVCGAKLDIVYVVTTRQGRNAKDRRLTPAMLATIFKDATGMQTTRATPAVIDAKTVVGGVVGFARKSKPDIAILQPSQYRHSELVGDLSRRIARELTIPTIFVKTGGSPPKGGKILYSVDEKRREGLDAALALAKTLSCGIIFYHTTWRKTGERSDDPMRHCESTVLENIRHIEDAAKKSGVQYKTVVETAETIHEGIILCAIRNEVSLIIMSRSTAIVGGASELVLDLSMCPLMVLP